ncbi:MAG: T9SS type A sorting domain-containing protein [Flavobacteriales bacterium]|nr:T9SS type A sorting domain-containing protein [Flavobacteriales bacterium]
MRLLYTFFLLTITTFVYSQKSVHQEQLEYYNSLGNADANYYEQNTKAAIKPATNKATCNLNKVVYGWHPYWVGNAYLNYDWNLLSHMSFFSYEVDAATGNANSTHGWATSAAVTAALASGNTKVTLCVTLFSSHATFFASPTAKQTLITNLINLVQSRGAHGVNIDFEGLPASQKTNFANFMVDLANQFHAAIPGSDVSTVLYAVDWNNVFDFAIMSNAVDKFIVMGYDYYWTGSTTAGPNDPLYHYSTTYNYNLSKSITYYLNKGCPSNKLIMGLPYYGREWPTSSTTVPSGATANGVARFYNDVKDNLNGYYSAGNHQQEVDSYSDVFVFNNGGTRQCFITLEDNFYKRLDHINNTGIGGMGIWALGYDDGYNQFWDGLNDYMTNCYVSPCSGIIHDFGGPTKNYNDNENYTWTIAPTGASSINLTFTSFDVETNFDYLYIYDGPTTASPQLAGSPFTGTTFPPVFNSSTGAITFRFTSDGATTKPGFNANYYCIQDTIKPTTAIAATSNPEYDDFTSNFTDADNVGGSGVKHRFYQVTDFDGVSWLSNEQNGFFNFQGSSTALTWTEVSGSWSTNAFGYAQLDESNGNTNSYASCNQNNATKYLYNYKFNITSIAANKRTGFHYMCDDASLTNRGNSYFVWFRQNDSKLQFYKVVNDTFSLKKEVPFTFNTSQNYDVKVVYDKTNGQTDVYVNDVFISSWADVSPLTAGNYISLRTGNCATAFNDVMVYKNRTASALITVGQNPTDDIRYEGTPAGRINSIVIDSAYNVSVVNTEFVNVDFLTSISETNIGGIKVYPNPAIKALTIELDELLQNGVLNIKDVSGKMVLSQQLSNTNKLTVPISHLAKGVYLLEITSDLGKQQLKFIKE